MIEKKNTKYAHFGYRFAAMMIDNLVLGIILSPIFTMIFGAKDYTEEQIQQILQTEGILGLFNPNELLLQQAAVLVITVFFWLRFAGTPGKRLLKIRVVDATTGKNLTMWQAVVRYFGYFIASFPLCLGFIWILFDEKNQGWHDKLSNSVVVKDSAYQPQGQEESDNLQIASVNSDDNTFVA